MNSSLNCYSIPAEKPFVNVLASWILGQYGKDAAMLTKALVLLPNRRACRSLREAFLECTEGKPILLPRIQPIGDLEDESIFHSYHALGSEIPATISTMRRELLLTGLVMHFKNKQSEITTGRSYNVEQAAELARQLARFIDDVAREGLSLDRLSALVPENMAMHWQQTLDFLDIISHRWPAILEEHHAIEPVEHRNRLILAVAEAWKKYPPPGPVIAAGSTGSMPATATLLATIARLPEGRVIVPGLDTDMPEKEWDMLTETHPQFGLRQLLATIGCKRQHVKTLEHGPIAPGTYSKRVTCLRAILQPPDATAGWAQATLPLADGLHGVSLLTADTLLDEARMIAIALRETLEIPGKTAALVTPDRTLARMVAAQMQRFGIEIDDSAGHPLSDTPAGCFLRLVAGMAASSAAPASLLALLRHPLAAVGLETAECRRLSRVLEMELLRGIRRMPGLDALCSAAADHKELTDMLAAIGKHVRPLAECFRQKKVSLRTLLEAHMACAEQLAATAGETGAQRLWAGEAGNRVAAFIAELLQNSDILKEVDPLSYPGLFEFMLAGQSYHTAYGLHPRLHILSPIEARLQHFDRVILGSLNEGTWPSPPEADPWMSRPMRSSFGLPAAERIIGQSAHDMYLLCTAPEVLLTRARKVEGMPTVPSRWLVRLETLVRGLDGTYYDTMRMDAHYDYGKKLLDSPVSMPPYVRPMPVPPIGARPRQLRVTAVDLWLRDPYIVYAQSILSLKKLSDLDEEPEAADFGTLVHRALERFTLAWPTLLPDRAHEVLLECGRAAFADMLDRPAVGCLWWPRFEAMAAWLVDEEKKRRPALARVLGELKGRWDFMVDGKAFVLTTRIDRMEIAPDGAVTIADYKTGAVPTDKDIERGLANQLLLEALIAMHGTLEPAMAPPAALAGLEYWKLAGCADDCEIRPIDTKAMEEAHKRLEGLIREYDKAMMPYAAQSDPSKMVRYNDYEHLTRRQEWEAV